MMAAFDIFTSWEAFAAAIGLISLGITTLIYMFSKAFDLPKVAMWAKGEYLQVGATFLIIVFAIGFQHAFLDTLLRLTEGIWAAAMPAGPAFAYDPIVIGQAYIESVVSCQKSVFWAVALINFYHEGAKSIGTDVIGVEPLSGGYLGGTVTVWNFIMGNITYLAVFNYIQYRFLGLISVTMLSIFLPIGLLFRSFALTRGVGGFITAFAIGFAFVYPLTYLMLFASLPHINALCTGIQQPAGLVAPDERPSFNNPSDIAIIRFKLKESQNEIAAFFDRITSLIPILLLQAMIFPIVSLIVTFTFVRQTGSLFGADLAEIGRGLIKLI